METRHPFSNVRPNPEDGDGAYEVRAVIKRNEYAQADVVDRNHGKSDRRDPDNPAHENFDVSMRTETEAHLGPKL